MIRMLIERLSGVKMRPSFLRGNDHRRTHVAARPATPDPTMAILILAVLCEVSAMEAG